MIALDHPDDRVRALEEKRQIALRQVALELSKNQAYWDRDYVPIANVAYIPLADEYAEWLRYRAGELDLTQSVPAAALTSIRKERAGKPTSHRF